MLACLSDIGNSVVNFPSNVANNLFLNRKLIYSLLIARLQIFNLSDCWYTPSRKNLNLTIMLTLFSCVAILDKKITM